MRVLPILRRRSIRRGGSFCFFVCLFSSSEGLFRTIRTTLAMVAPVSSSSLSSSAATAALANQHPPYQNVVLSSAFLMPVQEGQLMITAHATRHKILDLLDETQTRRRKTAINQKQAENEPQQQQQPRQTTTTKAKNDRAMIVDITATVWNWDTYAIVAGKPTPVTVRFPHKQDLLHWVSLDTQNRVTKGVLVPQTKHQPKPPEEGDHTETSNNNSAATTTEMVWLPQGAILKTETRLAPVHKEETLPILHEFVFAAPIDPNNDRLEQWEQDVTGTKQHLSTVRKDFAVDSMRSMMRFYDLDRIVCWDLSWGMWEAIRADTTVAGDVEMEEGYPPMLFVKPGRKNVLLTSSSSSSFDDQVFDDYCQPISPSALKNSLTNVLGYYLVGGNTYTMSLFHHMWDQQSQPQPPNPDDDDNDNDTKKTCRRDSSSDGHMQLLRDKVHDGTLFYTGHSAGLIMSGPNILTATWKGIDAFSVVTQPYNAPYVKLPPSESVASFFVAAEEINHLDVARQHMLSKMHQYQAWRGYNVVQAFAFPHYDARPRPASFPQSAETYLRATTAQGHFQQTEASLFIGTEPTTRREPAVVTTLRHATNAQVVPCYPVANGHALVLSSGGREVVETLSPEEEGHGILHFDTYMPYVPADPTWSQYGPGRTQFTTGSFTDDADTIAGDRSTAEVATDNAYNGARIFSRLQALGLPNPNQNTDEGTADRLFRTK